MGVDKWKMKRRSVIWVWALWGEEELGAMKAATVLTFWDSVTHHFPNCNEHLEVKQFGLEYIV